jgi:hypothetical protein
MDFLTTPNWAIQLVPFLPICLEIENMRRLDNKGSQSHLQEYNKTSAVEFFRSATSKLLYVWTTSTNVNEIDTFYTDFSALHWFLTDVVELISMSWVSETAAPI